MKTPRNSERKKKIERRESKGRDGEVQRAK